MMAFWIVLLLLSCIISTSFSKHGITIEKQIRLGFHHSSINTQRAEAFSAEKSSNPYNQKFFTQTLDHFNYNPKSYETFQQRYLVNDTYWGGPQNNSPIFVYTGNEGNIEWFAQNTGFMFENAPHFKALLVFIEHRYYGESIPFGDNKDIASSTSSSTLGYLTSTQAIADYVTLILDLKNNLSATNCPVILFGGSYGGMLAAWFRLKYPHVAIGALASSAPILNFDNITSPYSFYNIITKDFRSESENCYNVIKGSWQEMAEMATKSDGLRILRKSFNLCENFKSVDDLEGWLYTAYTYTAMTDYPTPANFMNPLPAYPVKQMCKAIDDPRNNNTFQKLFKAASIYYNYTGQVAKCFDLYDDSDTHGMALWSWQACTEMVLQTSGTTEDSMFPAYNYSYSDRVEYCKHNYGVEPRPTWVPTEFGGRNIYRDLKRFGSNLILFNGLRDPWSGGGVLKNISSSIIAIVAEEGAHHVDLRFSTSQDPTWLKNIREMEVQIISGWLSQYYQDLALFQNDN